MQCTRQHMLHAAAGYTIHMLNAAAGYTIHMLDAAAGYTIHMPHAAAGLLRKSFIAIIFQYHTKQLEDNECINKFLQQILYIYIYIYMCYSTFLNYLSKSFGCA